MVTLPPEPKYKKNQVLRFKHSYFHLLVLDVPTGTYHDGSASYRVLPVGGDPYLYSALCLEDDREWFALPDHMADDIRHRFDSTHINQEPVCPTP